MVAPHNPNDVLGDFEPARHHDACGVGLVVSIRKGLELQERRKIVDDALCMADCYKHRGAEDALGVGDGAGIITGLPERFFINRLSEIKTIDGQNTQATLEEGGFAVGQIFLSRNAEKMERQRTLVENMLREQFKGVEGFEIAGWRKVEVNKEVVSEATMAKLPDMQQIIFKKPASMSQDQFELGLYRARRKMEAVMFGLEGEERAEPDMHIASFSSRSIVYKGTLTSNKVRGFFKDLNEEDYAADWAAVHSRFSTNTAASPPSAHPFTMLLHNGEINTIEGNIVEWSSFVAEHYGIKFPAQKGLADSYFLNIVYEHLVMEEGLKPIEAMTLMIPPAIHGGMEKDVKTYMEYVGMVLSPFDGPANRVFTDGKMVAASLGRSGLRPARYTITTDADGNDDRLIYGSEEGIVKVANENVRKRGSLRGGEMIAVDMEQGNFLDHKAILAQLAKSEKVSGLFESYQDYVNDIRISLPQTKEEPEKKSYELSAAARQTAFGMHEEDWREHIKPMIQKGKVNVRAMGNDTRLNVFSSYASRITSYFSQLFAQVTNPPLDSIRERDNMSLQVTLGPNPLAHKKLKAEGKEQGKLIRLDSPILREGDIETLTKTATENGTRIVKFDMTFALNVDGVSITKQQFEQAIRSEAERVAQDIRDNGPAIIIMEDDGISRERAAMPSILAVAALDHELRKEKVRMSSSIVMDSNQLLNDHEVAAAIGFGADAVNTRMLHALIRDKHPSQFKLEDGTEITKEKASYHLHKALDDGLLKIMSKMGINDVRSYAGSRQFEALGLNLDPRQEGYLAEVFHGVYSPVKGHGLQEVLGNSVLLHQAGLERHDSKATELHHYGKISVHKKGKGETHLWGQETVDAFAHMIGAEARKRLHEELLPNYEKRLTSVNSEIETLKNGLGEPFRAALATLDEMEGKRSELRAAQTEIGLEINRVIDRYLPVPPEIGDDRQRMERKALLKAIEAARGTLDEKLKSDWAEVDVQGFRQFALEVAAELAGNLKDKVDENALDKFSVQFSLAVGENGAVIERAAGTVKARQEEIASLQTQLEAQKAALPGGMDANQSEALTQVESLLAQTHDFLQDVTRINAAISAGGDAAIDAARRGYSGSFRAALAEEKKRAKGLSDRETPYTKEEIDGHAISDAYRDFVKAIRGQRENDPVLLPDILKLTFKGTQEQVPTEQVTDQVSDIIKRISTGGMSDGALTTPAHKTLAQAMNRLGGKSNTGEGGEDKDRWGTITNSAIKQVASGRFGAIAEYLANAEEIEIKVAQGAKPGEGGQLPGQKVSVSVAIKRNAIPGTELISPPPHHDIYSIEDLAQLIYDLKSVRNHKGETPNVAVKLVSSRGVGVIATGVAKALAAAGIDEKTGKAGVISIVGNNGGTGASPVTSLYHAGLPKEIGIAEAHRALSEAGLRDLVDLRTGGGMLSAEDIIKAVILGADKVEFGTAAMIMMDCVMARLCGDNCPVGVATNAEKFLGDHRNVEQYILNIAAETREIVGKLGCHSLDEMRGKTELLEKLDPEALKDMGVRGNVDVETLLKKPDPAKVKTLTKEQISKLRKDIDVSRKDDFILENEEVQRLLKGEKNVGRGGWVDEDKQIVLDGGELTNSARSFGLRTSTAMSLMMQSASLAYEEKKGEPLEERESKVPDYYKQKYGGREGGRKIILPRDAIRVNTHGNAGQSFGAGLVEGLHLHHEGVVQDGAGKSMSGGILSLSAQKAADYKEYENVIAGNALLYGATGGEVYINGQAGERFAVRNSGAAVVVEGVGDHGAEYMTSGAIMNLGDMGRNFGSGMSGGIVFQYDPGSVYEFERKVNKTDVDIYTMEQMQRKFASKGRENDVRDMPFFDTMKNMLQQHIKHTDSERAKYILGHTKEVDELIKAAMDVSNVEQQVQAINDLADKAGLSEEKLNTLVAHYRTEENSDPNLISLRKNQRSNLAEKLVSLIEDNTLASEMGNFKIAISRQLVAERNQDVEQYVLGEMKEAFKERSDLDASMTSLVLARHQKAASAGIGG